MSSWWPVVLRHDPVVLRPVRSRDQAAWSQIRQRGADWFTPWDATRPQGNGGANLTFSQQVRTLKLRARRGTLLPLAVTYIPQAGSKPIFVGQVSVNGILDGSAQWGMIGYWIDPKYAGRGIIPLAVAMVSDYCFQQIGLHRLEVAIVPENEKSLAVVRKLGFHYEGRREKYLHVAGDWRDHDVFVLNADDVPEGLVNSFTQGG